MSTFPLPREIAEALKSKGALSKSFLDKVYLDTVQDEQQDIAVQQRQAQLAEQQAMAAEASQVQRLAEQAQLQNPGGVQVNGTYGRPTGINLSPSLADVAQAYEPQEVPNLRRSINPLTTSVAEVAQAYQRPPEEQILPESQRFVANQESQAALDAAGQAAQQGDTLSAAEMIERGLDLKARAALADSQAAAAAGSMKAREYAAQAKGLATEAEVTRARRQKYEQMLDDQMQKNMKLFDEYSSSKIDPNRLYANQTTGQKIMGAIGIALSSFAGKDGAMKAIDKAIQDDINLQKEQIDLTGLKLDKGRLLLKDMLDVTKDIDSASILARAALIEQTAARINQIASQTSSQVARNNATEILGDLELKKAELLGKVNDPAALERQATSEALYGGPIELTPQNLAKISTKTLKENLIPGFGVAKGEKQAEQVAETRPLLENSIAGLKRLRELRKEVGVESFDTAESKEADQIYGTLLNTSRKLFQMGALDASTLKVFENTLSSKPLKSGLFGSDSAISALDIGGLASGALIESGIAPDPLMTQIDGLLKLMESDYEKFLIQRMLGYTPEVYKERKGNELKNAPGVTRVK